jgi:hypothetical protein
MYFHKCWGSGPGWWRVPVPASQYVHPEFGFLCPTPRFRRRLRLALACLAVAGIGAGVLAAPGGPKLDAALTPVDQASIGDSIPAPSLTPFVGTQRAVVQGAPAAADKPSCVGDTRSERDCGLVKPRKPREHHRRDGPRRQRRPTRRLGEIGRSSGRRRKLGASQGDCHTQEGAEVGAPPDATPRSLLVRRSVLARGSGRRLGSARLRTKGARLPEGRIRFAQFLVTPARRRSGFRHPVGLWQRLSKSPRQVGPVNFSVPTRVT